MRTTFSRPQRLITGAVTGTLLITTMGFGTDAFAANGDPAPNAANAANGVNTLKMSLRSGKLAAPKASPRMLARAREMILRSKIVKIARAQIGDKYVAGQDGPNAFDCSGLTRYVYKTVTGKNLAIVTAVEAGDADQARQAVVAGDAQAGYEQLADLNADAAFWGAVGAGAQ